MAAPGNLLIDLPGVRVGNAHDARIATGATAVVFDVANVASAVTRGGAWHSEATHLRVSNREGVPRDYADLDTGFRCALDPS